MTGDQPRIFKAARGGTHPEFGRSKFVHVGKRPGSGDRLKLAINLVQRKRNESRVDSFMFIYGSRRFWDVD
jgi:hypothetical protein